MFQCSWSGEASEQSIVQQPLMRHDKLSFQCSVQTEVNLTVSQKEQRSSYIHYHKNIIVHLTMILFMIKQFHVCFVFFFFFFLFLFFFFTVPS